MFQWLRSVAAEIYVCKAHALNDCIIATAVLWNIYRKNKFHWALHIFFKLNEAWRVHSCLNKSKKNNSFPEIFCEILTKQCWI